MTRIRRNSKTYSEVLTNGSRYIAHTLHNCFVGEEVSMDWARANLLEDAMRAKAVMTKNEDGTFTVSWHSNRFYRISI